MSKPCELPPCPPCPPPTPQPCTQVCPPPPSPLSPCRVKPTMRGLHWSQTKSTLAQAIIMAAVGGISYYIFVATSRKEAYRTFYAKGEFEEWADEMARKGLFQSVPPESLKGDHHMKK